MSALFPVRVELAESHTIGDVLRGVSVTWTDISEFVLYRAGVTCSRGRGATAAMTTAGAASFTVKTKPNGDVAPLAVRRPVRISVYDRPTWADVEDLGSWADVLAVGSWDDVAATGTWHVIWTGTVSSWSRSWEGGVRGLQRVTCADAVATLNRAVMESWPTETAKAIGDLAWLFPLDDPSGETPPREASGVVSPPQMRPRPVGVPAEGTSVRFGVGASPGSPAGSGEGTTVGFEGSAFGGWSLAARDSLGGFPLVGDGIEFDVTLSAYVYLESTPQRDGAILAIGVDHYSRGMYCVLGVDDEGRAFGEWRNELGTVSRLTGASVLGTGRWHHVALTSFAGGGFLWEPTLWVNGDDEATDSDTVKYQLFGGRYDIRVGANIDGQYPLTGLVSHVAAFSKVLDSGEIGSLANICGGFELESTRARFDRVLGLIGYGYAGSSPLASDTNRGTMGRQALRGRSFADVATEIATVEHAPWYPLTTGVPFMASRSNRYNRTDAITLPASAVSASTDVETSDDNIANVVTVSRTGGPTTTLTDAASVTEYGRYPLTVTYAAGSDGEAETYGAALLVDRAEPATATETLTVEVTTVNKSVDEAAICAADVGSIVTVTGLPADSGYATAPKWFVEGVSDNFSPSGWRRTFNTSPVPASTSAWRVGTSALGTSTRLGL